MTRVAFKKLVTIRLASVLLDTRMIVAIYGEIGLYLCNRPACRASAAASSHRSTRRLLEITSL